MSFNYKITRTHVIALIAGVVLLVGGVAYYQRTRSITAHAEQLPAPSQKQKVLPAKYQQSLKEIEQRLQQLQSEAQSLNMARINVNANARWELGIPYGENDHWQLETAQIQGTAVYVLNYKTDDELKKMQAAQQPK